jgi:adenine C2-methylase RlmN of 23S rRNA A2503 and tRNA A37
MGVLTKKINLFGMNLIEIESILGEFGSFPKYKSRQIYEWIYKKREQNFQNMTNISKVN